MVGGRVVSLLRRVDWLGLLQRYLLVDDDCSVGWNRTMNVALAAVVLHILQQREDDEEHGEIEQKIGDGDPILQTDACKIRLRS